jgi:hypothetical protein
VSVAVGNTAGDSRGEIITGAGPGGGPHVRVFDSATGENIANIIAYDPAFTGGVYVAAGDLGGDSTAEIATSPGVGGGPHVRVFNGLFGAPHSSFLAYDPAFRGGVTVGAADINGDGFDELLTGAGPGGGPHVKAYRFEEFFTPTSILEFFAFDPTVTSGIFVG